MSITKLRTALAEKCKDMGLSAKALDRLAELGGASLSEDSTQADIDSAIDTLVPFALAMQAEVTRKTASQSGKKQSGKPSAGDSSEGNEGDSEGENKSEVIPAWAQSLQKQITALTAAAEKQSKETAAAERRTLIDTTAKRLGIPDYLMRRITLADDADVSKELAELKQELVNNKLMPKEQGHELGTTTQQMKADAKTWAQSLPDAK